MKNNSRIICACLGLWLLLPLQAAVPNPILKLSLDNNLTDSSGAVPAHNGTFQGGAAFSNDAPVPSAGNASVFLNGTNTPGACLLVANPVDFNLDTGSSFTFAAWIKKTYDSEDQHVIFAKAPPDVVEGDPKTPALYIDADNHLVWDVFYSGAAISEGTIPKGKWTHIAVSSDGGNVDFYVNGVPAGSDGLPATHEADSGWPTPWRVTIGATANLLFPGGELGNEGGILKGNIDNVMFWDSALSEADIYDVFTSTGEMILITANPFDQNAANVGHTAAVSAALGSAASFNGRDAGIAVPALIAGEAGTTYNQFTIEVWVNVSSFENPDGFECLYNHDGWSSGSLHMHVNPGNRWEFSVNGTAPTDQYVGDPSQPGLLSINQWYHFVAVYDADANSLLRYVNGQLVTNVTYDATAPIDLGTAHIGAWNGGSRYYNGLIDELAIYGSVLSAEQVAKHYQAAAIPVIGPAINYVLSGGKLTLSWSGTGFVLQQNDDLNIPTGWTVVPGGDASPATFNVGPGHQFFRLRKP